jgi:D-glycero-D-manno-heptose 1,7-bisphosphate phosphatase
MRSAVFLDRDGVINANRAGHVKAWEEFVFLPGVLDSLRLLAESPMAIVIITNQAAVGRGLITYEAVESIHRRMCAEIERAGGRIDAVFYCPHHPTDGCTCRKPRPGLLLKAAHELHLDLASSWLVGDAVSDVEAALSVQCSAILVLTGRGVEQYSALQRHGYNCVQVASNLPEAIDLIIARERSVLAAGVELGSA